MGVVVSAPGSDIGPSAIAGLLAEARSDRRAALARLLSFVERGGPDARSVGAAVHPLGGTASVVGITGAPGAGKSTLTSELCRSARSDGDRIAVLAVDPSSPFSGGAILGDRVRMGDHALDDGVFIRSMATRGHLGGLSLATPSAIRVLDAVGFPWVVVETVGVGQVEVEIVASADTCVVVVNPGWGDAVQANKAGLMEIADIFVINKADRPGAAEAEQDLRSMLSMRIDDGWNPPVVAVVALDGSGIGELWAAIGRHRSWLGSSGEGDRRRIRRVGQELRGIVAATLAARAGEIASGPAFDEVFEAVMARRVDPWTAAEALLG